ncbi:hypothetical protein ACS0TY_006807 [Phlomoides rotata]
MGYCEEVLHQCTTSRPCEKWYTPMFGSVKINVDVAQFEDIEQTGVGAVIRDRAGVFVVGRTMIFPGNLQLAVAEPELIGIHEALSWVKILGYEIITVKSNAQVVIKVI